MTNWNERAEAERRRCAQEQSLDQQTTQTIKREQEQVILQKLGLFSELGIPRTLEEIRRDLWHDYGTVATQEPRAEDGRGIVSSTLKEEIRRISPSEVTEYQMVNGPYQDYRSINMGNGTETVYRNGPHREAVGRKVIGVDDSQIVASASLLTSLGYSLDSDMYDLLIADKALKFEGSTLDRPVIAAFVDKAFLAYVTEARIPDFGEYAERERRKRDIIQANIGKITPHGLSSSIPNWP